jgi:nucleotide-binding universal stress UspA family protein
VSFAVREVKGDAIDETIAAAPYADLVVMGRADDESTVGDIASVLAGSGRPVLVAPSPPPENLAPTIAIAWKARPEAARAMGAAMPLLAKAERIVVLTAGEDSDGPRSILESAERVADHLRWHGLTVETRLVAPGRHTASRSVIDTAHELGADLLVMGGYGHSRLREFVLGGFTRDVLKSCALPVFLSH